MKCEIIIDKSCEERVVIYTKKINSLTDSIKQLVEKSSAGLIGYKNKEIVQLNIPEVYCFTVIGNKVYAICENEKLSLKERLYMVEENLPDFFIKINQSCIINIGKIDRFDASITGTLKIHLKNGYTDYVSRRQIKTIKERLGI